MMTQNTDETSLNNLEIGLRKYEIPKEILPKDSFLDNGRKSANLQPFSVWGPAPENLESFRQLNWTNLFLWKKLGTIEISEIELRLKILEEKLEQINKSLKKIRLLLGISPDE